MNRSYSVILSPEENGGYTVTVPAFPEAVTYGETVAEALLNAKECIELCIETRAADHEEIPEEISPIATSIVVVSPTVYA